MGGPVFWPCWLFGLRHPRTGAYRLLRGVRSSCQNGSFQESSRWRIFTDTSTTSVLVCTVSYICLPPPQESLQDQQVGLPQDPMKSLLFPWVLVHTRICVHPPRVESLFPPVLWSSCTQALLTFKAKYSGGSFSQCQTPRLMWGSEHSLLWENFCDIIVLQFVGHPPRGYEIWLYHECTPLTI